MSASNKVRSNTKVKVKRQSGKKVKYVIAEREKEEIGRASCRERV